MEQNRTSIVSAIALNTIFGYEPKFSHNLIDAVGSTEAIFEMTEDERIELFGPYNKILSKINGTALEAAEREYDRLTADGFQILSIYDDDYPDVLRECPDAPMALYVRSAHPASEIFNQKTGIAIVGTRDPSFYGKAWCENIVEAISFSPSKPVIVSGMALGIDIIAHTKSLEYGLPTIGVLPVGINEVYPRRHAAAAERIALAAGSALITDYPPGTPPTQVNFLRRNRIIAGLSTGTILVESKPKGGGMLTARLAFGYGRDVFALPGRIDDIRSQGCNQLIQEKIAEPITELYQLPGQLGLGVYNLRRKADLEATLRERLDGMIPPDEVENTVALALAVKRQRGICYDELCAALQLDYSCVSRYAGYLESEGILCVDLLQRCCINSKFK